MNDPKLCDFRVILAYILKKRLICSKCQLKSYYFGTDSRKESLYAAGEKLDSAANWGILDILGGGLIADCLVQSRISETREQLQDAIRHIEPIVRDLKQQMDER